MKELSRKSFMKVALGSVAVMFGVTGVAKAVTSSPEPEASVTIQGPYGETQQWVYAGRQMGKTMTAERMFAEQVQKDLDFYKGTRW